MRNTIIAIAVLMLLLGLSPISANAKCNWPVTEKTGAFDRAAYAKDASQSDVEGIKAKLFERHDLMTVCLKTFESLRYFGSASLVMGRYGRMHCDWKPVGKGSAERKEHTEFAKGKDLKELRAVLAERFDELAKCLKRSELDMLYADLCVLQDDHVLIGR
jgi:hypothetical protein